MGCIIELRKPCEGYELQAVRELDEAYEQREPEQDNRVPLDNPHIIIDTVDTGIAVTVLGRIDGCDIAATVVAPRVDIACDVHFASLCKNFKVIPEEPPF